MERDRNWEALKKQIPTTKMKEYTCPIYFHSSVRVLWGWKWNAPWIIKPYTSAGIVSKHYNNMNNNLAIIPAFKTKGDRRHLKLFKRPWALPTIIFLTVFGHWVCRLSLYRELNTKETLHWEILLSGAITYTSKQKFWVLWQAELVDRNPSSSHVQSSWLWIPSLVRKLVVPGQGHRLSRASVLRDSDTMAVFQHWQWTVTFSPFLSFFLFSLKCRVYKITAFGRVDKMICSTECRIFTKLCCYFIYNWIKT